MKKTKKIFFITILFLISSLLFINPQTASAGQASLSLSPADGGSYQTGSVFPVSIWVKTGGDKVDSVRASLTFPANLLEVQSITLQSYSASMGGNYFDNNGGIIYWGGGFYGGTTADSLFATIQFKAKATGSAAVNFASNSLMLSAGQSVPITKIGTTYNIVSAGQTPAAPAPAPATAKTTAPAPKTTQTPAAPAPASTTQIDNVLNSVSNEIGNNPTFSGKANIGSAKIKITIDEGLIVQEITADENGNWSWTLADEINPGIYKAQVTASDPANSDNFISQSQDFEITIKEAMEVLFDVILDINKETKRLKAGEKLKFHVKMLNFGEGITNDSVTNVNFEYVIENQSKQQVLKVSDKRQVLGREGEFDKEITLPKELKEGQYSIFAKMSYGDNQEASSADSFEVYKTGSILLYMALGGIILLALIVWLIIKISASWKKENSKKKRR